MLNEPCLHQKTSEAAAGETPLPKGWPYRFAAAAGLAVSTVYFAQPLLGRMGTEFGVDPSVIGLVVTATQLLYAAGLLLLVPLGDIVNRRKLIMGHMLLSAAALAVVGSAATLAQLLAGAAAVGMMAVVTQTLVAYASDQAKAAERGRTVGIVTGGIVIGILIARTFSGLMAAWFGWRSVYYVSSLLMLITAYLLSSMLPDVPKGGRGAQKLPYRNLIASVFRLFAAERVFRIRAVLAFLIFTAFSTLWTSMILPLSAPPFNLSEAQVGLMGLLGAAGAFGAAKAGSLADKGFGQRTTGISLVILLLSWLPIASLQHSLPLFLLGIVLLDFAVQAVHVTNQGLILATQPDARSRLTGGYMMFYSFGSALGAIVSTMLYAHFGWIAVCSWGAGISVLALLFWRATLKPAS